MVFYAARMIEHWLYEGPLDTAVIVSGQIIAQNPKLVLARGTRAVAFALAGQDEELAGVLAEFRPMLGRVPKDHFWLSTLFLFSVAQGFGLEDPKSAGDLYRLLHPYGALHTRRSGRLRPRLGHGDLATERVVLKASAYCSTHARPVDMSGFAMAATLIQSPRNYGAAGLAHGPCSGLSRPRAGVAPETEDVCA
jgi:hypothetical protein